MRITPTERITCTGGLGGTPEFTTMVTVELPGLWTEEELTDILRDLLSNLPITLPYGGQRAGGALVVNVSGEVPE